MICVPCRRREHEECPAVKKSQSTLCDCQHAVLGNNNEYVTSREDC